MKEKYFNLNFLYRIPSTLKLFLFIFLTFLGGLGFRVGLLILQGKILVNTSIKDVLKLTMNIFLFSNTFYRKSILDT